MQRTLAQQSAQDAEVGTSATSQDRLHAGTSAQQVRLLIRLGRLATSAPVACIQISLALWSVSNAHLGFTWTMMQELNAHCVIMEDLQMELLRRNALSVLEVQPPLAKESQPCLVALVKKAVFGKTTVHAQSALISLALYVREDLTSQNKKETHR